MTIFLWLAVLVLGITCLQLVSIIRQLKWKLEARETAPYNPGTTCVSLLPPGTYRRVKDPRLGFFIQIDAGNTEPDSRSIIPVWSYNPADLIWEKFIVGRNGEIQPIETLAPRRR